MKQVYEYRSAPNRGVVWLAGSAMAMLVAGVVFNDATQFMWLIWGLGSAILVWMLLPKPVAGIRVDDDFLVLSAWRNPRAIPLDTIAYLRATEESAETNVAIVYKDGNEEGIFIGDLPDIAVLVDVMAQRGIAVRDVY